MKLQLTLEPTDHFFKTDEGIPVRAWTGHTNRGTSVASFIAALPAAEGRDEELKEQLLEIPGSQIGQLKIKKDPDAQ